MADETPAGAGRVLDRFYDALTRSDAARARVCCTPDAVFWHNFDRKEIGLDEIAGSWADLGSQLSDIAFPVSARFPVESGLVQQHAMEATLPTGARIGWPICIVVTLRDGLIARLDEYIDRAGSYPAGEASAPKRPPSAINP